MQYNISNLACSFTGHRPQRLGFGFDESDERCLALNSVLRKEIDKLVSVGVTSFYTGMALGVDQWAASVVLDIKEMNPNIKLTAVVPHEGQSNNWTTEQRERYRDMLSACDNMVMFFRGYTPSYMFERNRYLVDRADYLLAVYDGKENGGTAYTVGYAKEKHKRVIIIDPRCVGGTAR